MKKTVHSFLTVRVRSSLLAATLGLLATLSTSQAQLTWDADSGSPGPQDGSGTWNTATNTWWNGTTNVNWTSGTAATIGAGVAGTYDISLTASTTVAGLTVNTSGYTVSNGSAVNLALATTSAATSTLTVNSGVTFNIGNNVTLQQRRNNSGSNIITGGGSVVFESGATWDSLSSTNAGATISGGSSVELKTGSNANMSRFIGVASGSLTFSGGNASFSTATGAISGLAIGNAAAGQEGTVTINGGTIDLNLNSSSTSSSVAFSSSGANGGGTLNLNGGTLIARNIARGGTAQKSLVFFNGSNVQVATNSSSTQRGSFVSTNFASSATNGLYVSTGGFNLNTAGFSDVVIGAVLNHDSNVITDGGLTLNDTVSASGRVTLNSANTYNGITRAERGTIALGASGSINSSSAVQLGVEGQFDTSAQTSFSLLANTRFDLNSTTAGLFTAGSNELVFDGVLQLNFLAGAPAASYNLFDFGSQSGTFDSFALSGSGFSGTFSSPTFSSNGYDFTFNYSTGVLSASVIPEPSTVALLFGGAGLFLVLRRKRNSRLS